MIQTSFPVDSLLQNMWQRYVQENIWLLTLTVLSEEKFVIKKGLSADKAVYVFIDDILCAIDNKTHICGLFCDLAKTFACVYHDILRAM
jgi:hypothetical protein